MNAAELFARIEEAGRTQELFEMIVFDIQDQLHGSIVTDDPYEATAFWTLMGWASQVQQSDQTNNLLAYLLGVKDIETYLSEFLATRSVEFHPAYLNVVQKLPEA